MSAPTRDSLQAPQRPRSGCFTVNGQPSAATGEKSSDHLASARADFLLTIEEVAELLKVPISWVYDRTRRRGMDRIPGFRLGKYWRFRESDVLGWLERQRSGGPANA
jgi:excisionase family DNA binding protein